MLTDVAGGDGMPLPAWARPFAAQRRVRAAFVTSAVAMLGAVWPPDPASTSAGTTPMLLLTAAGDQLIDPAHTRALAGLYPHATVHAFDAGHLRSIKEEPDRYGGTVAEFIGVVGAVAG